MEKTLKKTYCISGTTTSGKYVTVGFFDSIRWGITHFIEKYPRFKGKAELRTQMATYLGNGMLCANPGRWETIDSFETVKEMKEYTQKGESKWNM
mgnify:CR=1 FL=1